ncbi:MAG: hypothetical protein K6A63_01540 [Acholeplasmatales bacterium]|nr:hypothetical protein [Acholeplasmatales bacterium]
MIDKLYDSGCFDYQRFILSNLKGLSLTNDEAVVLIKILDCYRTSDVFDVIKLRESILIRKDKFENALSSLIDKNYYNIYLKEIDEVQTEVITVEGFFKKVEDLLNDKVVINEDSVKDILAIVKERLGRILSGTDVEIITSLVNDERYTKDDFISALDRLENKHISTIRALANELERGRTTPKASKTKKKEPDALDNFIAQLKKN